MNKTIVTVAVTVLLALAATPAVATTLTGGVTDYNQPTVDMEGHVTDLNAGLVNMPLQLTSDAYRSGLMTPEVWS